MSGFDLERAIAESQRIVLDEMGRGVDPEVLGDIGYEPVADLGPAWTYPVIRNATAELVDGCAVKDNLLTGAALVRFETGMSSTPKAIGLDPHRNDVGRFITGRINILG